MDSEKSELDFESVFGFDSDIRVRKRNSGLAGRVYQGPGTNSSPTIVWVQFFF
jgi:hypothetical protein